MKKADQYDFFLNIKLVIKLLNIKKSRKRILHRAKNIIKITKKY